MATETWGDYEVFFDKMLGRGGMGSVYLGRQVSLDRPVAVKVLKRDLSDDPEFVKRFQREASLLAKLIDPHVVQVFGAGVVNGQNFFAMEFVEGEDLAVTLKRQAKFPPAEVVRIALHTAEALQTAWKHKIIHRDIKPSNIIITKDGNQVKVMDFGLAKSQGADLTATQEILGTAKYMSPEQATGAPVDIRSDLYSLGAVLYELSTGVPPFVGENPTSVVYQHVHKEPRTLREVNAEVPEPLEALVLKLLAKNPDQRCQTPDEVIEYCRALMGNRETPKSAAPALPTAPPPKRSLVGVSIAVILGLGAVGAGGYFAWKKLMKTLKIATTNLYGKTGAGAPFSGSAV